MKSSHNKINFFSTADKILDFILNFAIVYISFWFVKFFKEEQLPFDNGQAGFIAGILCLCISFLYIYQDVYTPMRTQTPLFFIGRIFFSNLEVMGLLLVVILMMNKEGTVESMLSWLVSASIFSTLILISKKIILMSFLHTLRARQRNIKHIIVVTDSQEMADAYMEEIYNNPQFGYEVIGYVGNLNIIGLTHLGTTGDLDRVLTQYAPDEVIMAFDTVRKKLITRYISVCNNHCIKTLVVPAICGYFKSPRQITVMGNLPLIDIRSTPLDDLGNRILKRSLDIVVSLILIVLTSPFMIFTAIGVKISSPGPILFRQTRVGRNNKEFTMYKFRSMRVNATEQTGWSTGIDPRKTKFGNFIRKTALDELPQFFNVLKGDMSLVGPRPEVPFYVEKFKKEIPLYMLKHTLRPGITGLAQIKGLRGDTSIQARIDADINYIENWTFFGDIRILLLTPFHTVNRHEKYVAREKMETERREARGESLNLEPHEEENDETV